MKKPFNIKIYEILEIFFFAIDIAIFFMSQFNSKLMVEFLPQFNKKSVDNTYPRLVGILFIALGLARLYGYLYINEKGIFIVSM